MARNTLGSFLSERGIALRPHQTTAIKLLYPRGSGFLFQDTRSGKTLTTCLLAKLWGAKTLVVGPPKLKIQWEKEFESYGIDGTFVSEGMITNTNNRQLFSKLAKSGEYDLLVVDEAHSLRGGYSKTFVKRVAPYTKYFPRALGLTATPWKDNPAEAYYLFRCIDKECVLPPTIDEFYSDWCKMDNPRAPHPKWLMREDKEQELLEHLDTCTGYYKQDVQDYKIVHAPYQVDEDIQTLVREVYEGNFPPFALPEDKNMSNGRPKPGHMLFNCRRAKAFQLLNGLYLDREDEEGEDPQVFDLLEYTNKHEVIDKIVAERPGPVIIWYTYIFEREHLLEKYGEEGILYDPKKQDEINSGKYRYIFAHIASAGAGVNLSVANTSIFMWTSFDTIKKLQALARFAKYEGSEVENVAYVMYPDAYCEYRSTGRDQNKKGKLGKELMQEILDSLGSTQEVLGRG